jgi:hypothetical protein
VNKKCDQKDALFGISVLIATRGTWNFRKEGSHSTTGGGEETTQYGPIGTANRIYDRKCHFLLK